MKLKKCIFEKPKYKYKEDIKIRTLQHSRDSVFADNDYFFTYPKFALKENRICKLKSL